MRTVLAALAMALLMISQADAQRGGGDSGGRFGGGRGGGGFQGGGFPGGTRGGAPGGGFSGGTRGGAPMGGRGGAPTGGRGGDTGGRGGGGFNPADILGRFDANRNGMIDPDEAQGPAQGFLQRIAQANPKIDLSKPIPLKVLASEFEKMRGGGGGDSGDSRSGDSDVPELLVPDFSVSLIPEPIPGFGAAASLFSVEVQERDIKEAEERMRRYDRNRDGLLDAGELRSGRWSDDPMQYDRNRDGKLSQSEMAVRYANQRVEEADRRAQRDSSRSSSGWGGRRGENGGWQRSGREEEEPEANRFGDAKSYRLSSSESRTISGLPDFFAQRDADGDGQVMMAEYSSSWNEETLLEFMKWDLNGDGIIEPRECLVAQRYEGGSSSSSSSSTASSTPASGSSAIGGTQIEWAKRQIGKYDKNSDGQLTADEWESMIVKPTGADYDGDGAITVEEYAKFRG